MLRRCCRVQVLHRTILTQNNKNIEWETENNCGFFTGNFVLELSIVWKILKMWHLEAQNHSSCVFPSGPGKDESSRIKGVKCPLTLRELSYHRQVLIILEVKWREYHKDLPKELKRRTEANSLFAKVIEIGHERRNNSLKALPMPGS